MKVKHSCCLWTCRYCSEYGTQGERSRVWHCAADGRLHDDKYRSVLWRLKQTRSLHFLSLSLVIGWRFLLVLWVARTVICLERAANDLHTVHPVISCFVDIQIDLTFPLVPTCPGCPEKEAAK